MIRKKILIVMEGYFPGKKYGGPPVSVNNFCSLMSDFDIYIVTRDHDLNSKERYSDIETGWNKRDNCSVKYLKNNEFNYYSFDEIVQSLRPDYIYLQSLFQSCIFSCLSIAKKNKIKVILAPRGELCGGAFRKKYKKIPYIILLHFFGLLKNVIFQSTSKEESDKINGYLKASPDCIHLLTNIPSFPKSDFPTKNKVGGCAKFIFLSRIHPKKNLLGAIKYLKSVTGNVKFDIYGPTEDLLYWEECKAEINFLPDNISVNYCGIVSHEDIHKTFNKYDAFLFPTLSENYGHVIAEALFSQCPVIISDQTPWLDISENNAGFVISLNDEKGFIKAIQSIIDSSSNEIYINANKYITRKYDLNTLHSSYSSLFK